MITSRKQQVQNITLIIYTENWYVDNGATAHFTNSSDVFVDSEEFGSNHSVTTARQMRLLFLRKGKGHVVESNAYGKKTRLTLSDVWYVPTLTKNLFSVLAVQHKLTKECRMVLNYLNDEVFVVGKRNHNGGLYKLQLKTILPKLHVQVP